MTARSSPFDAGDSFPTHPMRSSSFSSDVMSNSARSSGPAPMVPHANPPPAYVAASEASDLISLELGRKVHVAPAALTLLNDFLDHVLYSILCASHSVSLGQLRAAVPVVLKPRLGKSALKVAEEELKDYIEDDEVEEMYSAKNNIQPRTVFDTDLVWKLTRLRCMVYARMGDLEEEDEEEWLEREGLSHQAGAFSAASRSSMTIAPGASIFLTSVVEYLGEQALYFAAQHAQKRHDTVRRTTNAGTDPGAQINTRESEILLEGKDMNHVGRDSPLSRLWRSWRRNTRSPLDGSSRPMSPEDALPPSIASFHSHSSSLSGPQSLSSGAAPRRMSNNSVITASRIPLPISENDINEIEGHAPIMNGFDHEKGSRRPLSLQILPRRSLEDVADSSPTVPAFQERSPLRPKFERIRSNSLPTGERSFSSKRDAIVPTPKAHVDTLRDGPTPTPDKNVPSARRNSEPVLEPSVVTANAIAGALGAVGVHHVQQREALRPLEVNTTNPQPGNQSKSVDQPLTSASITGPADFDMMYVPESGPSPEESQVVEQEATSAPETRPKEEDRYQTLAAQQLEEHQQYSKQVQSMETPSIYSDTQHSPRFPRDVLNFQTASGQHISNQLKSMPEDTPEPAKLEEIGKAISKDSAEQTPTPSDNRPTPTPEPQRAMSPDTVSPIVGRTTTPYAPSSYAPTPEPGMIYDENGVYLYGAPFIEADHSSRRQTDSPISQMSGKYPTRKFPAAEESIPEVPKIRSTQQDSDRKPTAPDARGHSKSSSSSSKLLGFTRDMEGKPQSIYQQSASGGMTDEDRRAHSSTPDHKQSLSDIDQLNSSPRRHHLRIRADSEVNEMVTVTNDYDRHRSLENLIKSDETLHYSLTPIQAQFREEDIKPPPKRTQTQDLADFLRSTAPPGQEHTSLPSTRSRKASLNATRAPQVLPVARGPVPSTKEYGSSTTPKPKHKNLIGEPRDAKVERMSGVRDLADYARSTGPSNADQLPKPLVGSSVLQTQRPVEMAAPTSPVDRSSTPARAQSRLKFQARDPRPSRHAESSDLVDFIRNGPPASKGGERAELQSSSARSTTGSDSTNKRTSSILKSSSDTNGIRSATDSQSPLLEQPNRAVKSTKFSSAEPISQPEEAGKLQEKDRRKVKDPYAIDYDDEDEDEDTSNTRRKSRPKNEESLIDFLRNTEPTSASLAQPILSPTAIVAAKKSMLNASNTAKRQSSEPQLRARAESPHLTQAGSKLDSYRPTQATHASHVDRNRNSKSILRNGSIPVTPRSTSGNIISTMKAFGSSQGQTTAEFDDYLKNTGPSPMQAGWTEPLVVNNRAVNGVKSAGGDGGGLRKFFSLKRK